MKRLFITGSLLCATIVCHLILARPADRIVIEPAVKGGFRFGPPELTVWAGGQIHFCNETGEEHQPGVLNDDGAFVAFHAAVLKPGCVSSVFSPMPRINEKSEKKEQVAFTIHHVCGLHRSEQGTINVLPTP